MSKEYHELRYLETSNPNNSTFSLNDDPGDRMTLLDLIKDNDRIVLLGNPGIGKTTELQNTFNILWESIEETEMLPIFINIKYFRQTSTIEDLIPSEDWKEMPSVLFFLDGLDEIANIQDFISALENFMSKYTDKKLKFIVSCRTNIYQKYSVSIRGFITVYLKNLSPFQVYNILEKKYEIDTSTIDLSSFSAVLQTPFNLDRFADYYNEKGEFPKNLREALKLTVDKEIEKALSIIIGHGHQVTKAEVIIAMQEVSIVNELMQQNSITEDHLFRLLRSRGIAIFQELPFIEKLHATDSYVFRHKNFQEYFAATYLAGLDIEQILNFIKVDGLEKIQPNLFNTITFLLNILDDSKVSRIEQWLLENDKEVLFFAEKDRLDRVLRETLFERYFIEVCLEKTFWITNNSKIPTEVMADFANFDFLLGQLKNNDNHIRARSSALEILSYKHLSQSETDLLKKEIETLITVGESQLKSQALRTIKTQKYYLDNAFFTPIIQYLKDSEDSDNLHQMISILSSMDDQSRDSDALLHFIKRYYSISSDNVIRGTENIIAGLLLKTNDWQLNLSLMEILFDDGYSIRSNSIYFDNFEYQLKEKSKEFSRNPEYFKRLLEIAFSVNYRIVTNQVLKDILTEIGIKPEFVVDLLKKGEVSRDILYSISSFLTTDSIDAIVVEYNNGSLKFNNDDDISSLRNWISNVNLDLALYLQTEFEKTGYKFTVELLAEDEIEIKRKEYNAFQLENFQLLFDKDLIIEKTKEYFTENNVYVLTKSEFQKLFWKWYDKTHYHGLQYTVHTVLEAVFRDYSSITPEIVSNALEDQYIYLSAIKTGLSHHSSRNYQISPDQLRLMENLTKQLSSKIDFENVVRINPDDPDIFHTTRYFEYINLILFFDFNYEIEQDANFYLNALEFGNLTGNNKIEENSFVLHVVRRVKDDVAVKNKVVSNILDRNLIFIAKRDHYTYAINNDLKETYEKIGQEIKNDGASLDQLNFLENYVSKIDQQLQFLKECCGEKTNHFSWRIIDLIKTKFDDKQFLLEFALQYLETGDIYFIDEAINILFFLNAENALHYYYKCLLKIVEVMPDTSGFLPKDFKYYNRLNEIGLFEDLFNLIFDQNNNDSFYLHYSRNFMAQLSAKFSETDEAYYLLQDILLKIKDRCKSEDKTYYIHYLIDVSDDSRLKSKSKKLPFEEAQALVKNLK
ncbi:NACHT domain-containing NTPase [Sphingobacterium thalpophilum]|uniref:NACHT domain-containing protein n=1 Tax=Sphingobacterium thalpophilum TaxID=259 RepID=UPI0037DA01AE